MAEREQGMSDVIMFPEGGYRYIRAVFQYSGGVAAESGFEIERARFTHPLPLAEGFAAAEAHLNAMGRPLAAFCACELRSPAPFTESAFYAFNGAYTETLERWGIYRAGINPVARTNVCPAFEPPAVPSLYAFSYTVPSQTKGRGTFVIAGSGEAPEGKANYRDHIVRLGDTSPDGLRDKVRYVVTEMEHRLAALGFSWADAVESQAYTVHDIGFLVVQGMAPHAISVHGLAWHICRPPVVDLEFEMDVRATARTVMCSG